MCYARGGTWLKSLSDSPEPPRRRLWVKWPESYFERRPPGSRAAASTTTAGQQWSVEVVEEVRGKAHFVWFPRNGEVTATAQPDSPGLNLCQILPEYQPEGSALLLSKSVSEILNVVCSGSLFLLVTLFAIFLHLGIVAWRADPKKSWQLESSVLKTLNQLTLRESNHFLLCHVTLHSFNSAPTDVLPLIVDW